MLQNFHTYLNKDQDSTLKLLFFKLPSYTLAGFDFTTHSYLTFKIFKIPLSYLPRFLHFEQEDPLAVEQVISDLDQRRRLPDDLIPQAPIELQTLQAEPRPVVELGGKLGQPLGAL
jgi:hypothetical protein